MSFDGSGLIEETDFLAHIYDIIKCIERESSENNSGKQRGGGSEDSSSAKIIEFQKKLQHIREQILALPGIEYSKEAQLKKFSSLQQQLVLKKKLLQKYKEMSHQLEGDNLKDYLGI